MRRVKFKYYQQPTKACSNPWVDAVGFFHQWGSSFQEFENGPGNFTTAIVEDEAGKIHEVSPSYVVFLEPLNDKDEKTQTGRCGTLTTP